MKTNAMPVLLGSALSNCVNASKPPAEAPTATIGKEAVLSVVSERVRVSVGSEVDGVLESGRFRILGLSGRCSACSIRPGIFRDPTRVSALILSHETGTTPRLAG